jgi:hypothetical protein
MPYSLPQCKEAFGFQAEYEARRQAMAKIVQYECDGCGKIKGADNHWFSVSTEGDSFEVSRFDRNASRVFCGEGCVVNALSAWLATGIMRKVQPVRPEELAVVINQ